MYVSEYLYVYTCLYLTQVHYPVDRVQLKLLQLMSSEASQSITYHQLQRQKAVQTLTFDGGGDACVFMREFGGDLLQLGNRDSAVRQRHCFSEQQVHISSIEPHSYWVGGNMYDIFRLTIYVCSTTLPAYIVCIHVHVLVDP